MSTLFVSDLHLSHDQPAITQLFLNFLQHQARKADALYILGDLFETWLGDDDVNSFNQLIITALAELSDNGLSVYFMPGNRDFLIGKHFIQQTGSHYLTDPSVIDLYGVSTLLTHGDNWCTLDKKYLRFRRWSRNAFWQNLFLHLPLAWRQKIAQYLRHQEHACPGRSEAKYDVVLADLLDHLRLYPDTQQIIHGHTHLPSIQFIKKTDGTWIRRFVLSDWHPTRANVLIARPDQTLSLVYFKN